MKRLGPQLNKLRDSRKRPLFATDINHGNKSRTYATLFKLGMLDWDPLIRGLIVVTALGAQKLKESREHKLANRSPSLVRLRKAPFP